jgi:hypothetical protein
MVTASITDLGPDTVDLVVRAPITGPGGAPVLDQWGRPQRAESTITRTRCSVQINDGTEEVLGSVISVLKLRAMLPVDEATEALTAGDAAVFKGRRYELTMPGVRHEFLEGDPSHVRIAGTWASDVSLGEQVTVIPAGRRLDDGNFSEDGPPVDVIAKAVFAGSSNALPLVPSQISQRFGNTGEQVLADFTVVLDLDAPISDGDWIVVRGRECRATVQRREDPEPARRVLVVYAAYRAGGNG